MPRISTKRNCPARTFLSSDIAARACAALVLAACTCCAATPYTFDELLSLTAAAASATGEHSAVVVRWRFTQRYA